MSEEQARALISMLTEDQKRALSRLLDTIEVQRGNRSETES